MSSTQFVLFGPIGKPRWPPGLWLTETFSTSPLKLLNRIFRNLTGSKISTYSAKFMFFGPIEKKNKMAARPLFGWGFFDSQRLWQIGKPRWPPGLWLVEIFFYLSSVTAERNSRKLNRKQDLNVFYQAFVFWPIGKPAAPASDGWDIFDCSSEITEQNPTKHDS